MTAKSKMPHSSSFLLCSSTLEQTRAKICTRMLRTTHHRHHDQRSLTWPRLVLIHGRDWFLSMIAAFFLAKAPCKNLLIALPRNLGFYPLVRTACFRRRFSLSIPVSPQDLPIEAFRAYYAAEGPFAEYGLETLEERYEWQSPDAAAHYLPFDPSLSTFEYTCQLKVEFARRWKHGPEDHAELAEFVVKDWGRIRRNALDVMVAHRINAERREPELKIKGIASLSKILMTADPERFAIYDSRVATSLISIQLLHGSESGIIFPLPTGQNRLIQTFAENTADKILKRERPGWILLPKNDGYRTYLDILHRLSAEFDAPIQHLEMSLFGDAENLARQAGRV